MEMTSAFTLNVRLDNIAVITIDVPGEKMNTCLLYTSPSPRD